MDTNTHEGHADVSYGGFWKRLAAFIIDAVIISIVLAILGVHAGSSYGYGNMMYGYNNMMSGFGRWGSYGYSMVPYAGTSLFSFGLVKIVLGWLYYSIMESTKHQATLGKMALGMKVTDLQGNRINFGRATGRHFAKIISALIFCIGFLMIAFTKHKQGLHDIIAGTLVINK